MASAPTVADVHDAVAARGSVGTPVTTVEVSESFECSDRTIYNRLETLVDNNVLKTKKVGASGRVWWQPTDEGANKERANGRYRPLFESLNEGFCVVEVVFDDANQPVDGTFRQTNSVFAELTGLQEAAGKRIRELELEYAADWIETFGQVVKTGESIHFTQSFDQPEEQRHEINAVPIGEPHDQTVAVLVDNGTKSDESITSPQPNDSRFEALIEATTEGVYRISPDWSEIYELASEGFVADDRSMSWKEYIPDDEQERVGAAIEEAIETQSPFEMEHRVKRADGTIGWTHSRAVPMIEDGEIVEWFGTSKDITDRKEREQKLKSQQEWRKAIFEGSRDAVFISDSDGNFVEVNAAASDLTGYDREELLSMQIPDLHEDVDLDSYRKYHNQVLEGDSILTEDQVLRADGSKIPVEFNSRSIEVDGTVYMHTTARNVAVRQERSAELKRRETYLESVSDLVTVIDEDGSIQYESPSVTELLGYEPAERVGDVAFEYVHPDDRDRTKKLFQETLEDDGISEPFEYRAKTPAGEWIWFESKTRNFTDESSIGGVIVTSRDITERKQQQEQKEMLWQAIEKADSPLLLAEPGEEDNPMTYVNDAWEKLTGYDEAEAIGRDCRFLQGENTRKQPVDEIRAAINHEEPVTVELRNYRKDGTEFWNEVTIEPVYDTNGDLVRYLGTQRDITERKEREMELKRHEIYLESISEGISVLDENAVFTYESPNLYEQLGYEPDERIGDVAYEYVHPDDRDRVRENFQRRLAGDNSGTTEFRAKTKDGSWVWLEAEGSNLTDSQVINGMIITTREITERKEQEHRRKQVIDRITDGILRSDADGEFIYVSDRARDLLDAADADLIGQNVFDEFAEARGTEYEERFTEVVESREPTSFVAPYPGRECWFDVQLYPNEDGGLSSYFRDVTERVKREEARQRAETQYQTLLEMAPLPIVAVDTTTSDIIEANEAAGNLLECQPNELIGKDKQTIWPDEKEELYHQSFQNAVQQEGTLRNLPDGSPTELATVNGETIPVETKVRTVSVAGDEVIYGIIRDITDERQYEKRISSLDEITQSLSGAKTEQEVKQVAADVLADTLDVSTVAFYRFADDEWELNPVVVNGEASEVGETELPVIEPGDGIEWTALKNGRIEVVDTFDTEASIAHANRQMQSEIAVPIDEKSVLVVGDSQPAAFDTWTVNLVETLGAVVETAITRTRQQQKLHQQNQQLRAIKSLNEQIRDIAQAIVEADTRADLEELVCNRLINAEQIDFVWIGRVDYQDNHVSPQTQAGVAQGYLQAVSLSLDDTDEAEPSVQAAHSKAVCNCLATTTQLLDSEWRTEAVERNFRSVLSIPLVTEERLYGILSIYSTNQDGLTPALRSVLEECGELLADAVAAHERRGALHADQAVELRFDIQDQKCLFDRLVAGTDCTIKLNRHISQKGSSTLVFLEITAGTAEQVAKQAEQVACVQSSNLVSNDGDPLLQLSVDDSFIATTLADSEYVLTGAQATPDETQITIEVPTAADTRQAVTLIESQFANTRLLTKQTVETLSGESDSVPGHLLESLTSRQREVIETAYEAGYFESPRQVNGKEVAELFGFSDTAFHQHIRDAQSNLLDELLSAAETSLPLTDSSDAN